MTTTPKTLTWNRVCAGHYKTTCGRYEIIEQSVYADGPASGYGRRAWNLVIDGCCDDAYPTKGQATWAAAVHALEDQR